MPIYEYQCKACGHQLEAFQKISEKPLTTCPACQQNELDKLISAAGLQFKGAGWYRTDYQKTTSSDKHDKKDTASTQTTTTDAAEKKTSQSSSGAAE